MIQILKYASFCIILLSNFFNVLLHTLKFRKNKFKKNSFDNNKEETKNTENTKNTEKIIPVSVNYHFTRKCNYSCGFCFHTSKTSYIAPLDDAKKVLKMLKDEGMQKVNFAGGEPFLKPKFLGQLVQFCKEELNLSVSIVSNGSLIKQKWFKEFGRYLDILAISVDSFDENTNIKIGRGRGKHLQNLENIRNWCQEYNVKFKINSVINAYNFEEDMNENIEKLKPFRWKVFQCLLLKGENDGENTLRDARRFLISNEDYDKFIERHMGKHKDVLVRESNKEMKDSYLILDEYFRFLNCSEGGKQPSESILSVGVQEALRQSKFDANMFSVRGGIYDWYSSKENNDKCNSSCGVGKELEW